jgi:hypothetical protein
MAVRSKWVELCDALYRLPNLSQVYLWYAEWLSGINPGAAEAMRVPVPMAADMTADLPVPVDFYLKDIEDMVPKIRHHKRGHSRWYANIYAGKIWRVDVPGPMYSPVSYGIACKFHQPRSFCSTLRDLILHE